MTFSIWTGHATEAILDNAEDMAKKFQLSPEKIFADLENVKLHASSLTQDAYDATEETNYPRIEVIKISVEAAQKELLLMILAYEKLIVRVPVAAVCDKEYEKSIMLWNILNDLIIHLKGRLLVLKMRS